MEKYALELFMGEVLEVRLRPNLLDQPESATGSGLVPNQLLPKKQEETRRLTEKCRCIEQDLVLEQKGRRRIENVKLDCLVRVLTSVRDVSFPICFTEWWCKNIWWKLRTFLILLTNVYIVFLLNFRTPSLDDSRAIYLHTTETMFSQGPTR